MRPGIQGNALKPFNTVIARLDRAISTTLLSLPGSTGQSHQYCQIEIPRSRLTPRRGMTIFLERQKKRKLLLSRKKNKWITTGFIS
jgi:hypothetical protein